MKYLVLHVLFVLVLIAQVALPCPFSRVKRSIAFHRRSLQQIQSKYKPSDVDWQSVITACKATFRFENRLANFYIRGADHDALATLKNFGGVDGSVVLTTDELRRSENFYDHFAFKLSKSVRALSKMYKASIADVLAVCGAVAVEFLGGPNLFTLETTVPFYVGRLDGDLYMPNPNTLPHNNMNVSEFITFSIERGFTIEEMVALMGSHSLIDDFGCIQSMHNKLRMFTWSNAYYKDLCNTKTIIHDSLVERKAIYDEIKTKAIIDLEMCKYSSKFFKDDVLQNIIQYPEKVFQELDYVKVEIEKGFDIQGQSNLVWNYTTHDAWMGKACQGLLKNTPDNTAVMNAMKVFANDENYWNLMYSRAYKKMMNIGVLWSNKISITGNECKSGYVASDKKTKCDKCKINMLFCPSTCLCKTAFSDKALFYETNM